MHQFLPHRSNHYNIVQHCVCSLSYQACSAHAPYCHLWPIHIYNILSHYLIKRTIFRKKVIAHKMCVLIYYTNFVCNISHAKKNLVRYYHEYTYVFTESTHYPWRILMKLEFSSQIFLKILRITKFIKIHPVGAELFHTAGWRDKQTYMMKQTVTFCNFVKCT